MSTGASWTDETSAISAAVAALAAILTLLVAVIAARYAARQVAAAREQLDEARRLRREQAQAYVIVYARTLDHISPQLVDVVIENVGLTGAHNIVIACTPPLVRTDGAGGVQEVQLPEGMPFLAPRQQWRTFWDSAITRKDAGLPDRFEVAVHYDDTFGQRHEETFILDWRTFSGRLFTDEKTVHHAAKSLAEIVKILKARSKSRGVLKVATYDGKEYDEQAAREEAAREAALEEAWERRQDLVRRVLPDTEE